MFRLINLLPLGDKFNDHLYNKHKHSAKTFSYQYQRDVLKEFYLLQYLK